VHLPGHDFGLLVKRTRSVHVSGGEQLFWGSEGQTLTGSLPEFLTGELSVYLAYHLNTAFQSLQNGTDFIVSKSASVLRVLLHDMFNFVDNAPL
jgi:hypothetical protein